jgi:hypothetical protein
LSRGGSSNSFAQVVNYFTASFKYLKAEAQGPQKPIEIL